MSGREIIYGIKSIKANKLRSILTISLITVGISAMVGIETLVNTIGRELVLTYSELGEGITHIRGSSQNPITYPQAKLFLKNFSSQKNSALLNRAFSGCSVRYLNKITPSYCEICAITSEYLNILHQELSFGRNFSPHEEFSGTNYCIVGGNIADELFEEETPIGAKIEIQGRWFEVIGRLAGKGDKSQGSTDNQIFIPVNNTIFNTNGAKENFEIVARDTNGRVEKLFDILLRGKEESHKKYHIERSEQLTQELQENMDSLYIAGAIITLVTMLGAAIGLMNIMLVQVEEKRRELGIRKALGAKSSDIKRLLLTEAIVISLCGSLIGTIAGIILSGAATRYLGVPLVISFGTILRAVLVCSITALTGGYIPAIKGAKTSIVEAIKDL